MNKNQQFIFNGTASYVAPCMKSVKLHIRQSILTVSNPGDRWINGGGGLYDDDEQNDNGEY